MRWELSNLSYRECNKNQISCALSTIGCVAAKFMWSFHFQSYHLRGKCKAYALLPYFWDQGLWNVDQIFLGIWYMKPKQKKKKKKKNNSKNKNKTPLSENLKSTHLPVVAKTRQKIEACFSINFQYLFLFGFRYCDTCQRLSEWDQ